mmetsp:Transcript_8420/g.26112  ORF Transcript_8420/g.26112 Transcript_8420/m.26112 type:complete len:153 (-) Transcript_8420:36-494(-)
MVCMAKSIEAKFGSSGVTAASLHPGSGVPTSIARQWKVAMWFHQKLISWFVKDLDQGSSTTLFCCLAEHDELRGRYFNDCAAYPSSDLATPAACECLWEVSEALVARAMIDPRPADVYIGPSSALSLASGCGFGKSEVSGTVEVHSPEIRSQ